MKKITTLLNGSLNVTYDSVFLQDIIFRNKNHVCVLECSVILTLCQVIYINLICMVPCSLRYGTRISTLYLHIKMVALSIHCINI